MKLLQSLFQSKKFMAMLVGVIGVVILKVFKVEVDPASIAEIVGLIAAYVIGQGIADNGALAAKIKAVSEASNSDRVTPDADKAIKAMAEELK